MKDVQELLQKAKQAKPKLATLTEQQKNGLLEAMAQSILDMQQDILQANALDIANGMGKIPSVMLDRLRLDEERIKAMAEGVLAVADLPTPLGKIEDQRMHANGMTIQKVRVPIGVVAIIYESRPNVTTDAAALCIKSGNVCVLRGGSDAIETNKAIVSALRSAVAKENGPKDAVLLVEDTTHDSARTLMEGHGFVDLLIPRGGKDLIRAVVEGARGVPVIETGTGICHIYVDKSADIDKAISILYNAKTSRPSVCNSAEVCLVHSDIAAAFLPLAQEKLSEKKVEFRLDARSATIIDGVEASEQDFDTEFNDFILAVAVVDSLEEAVQHINMHSTGHSEAIITEDQAASNLFCKEVDSAAVYVNASTRFTDGGEFGMGCEMGISTQKIGARGPMGLYELTSYKYVITGDGQVR